MSRIFGSAESNLKGLVTTCMMVALALVAAMLLKFPLEMVFPLTPGVNCVKHAGSSRGA